MIGFYYDGISNNTSLSFSTSDTVEPVLISSNPSNNSIEVVESDDIVLTFSEIVENDKGNIKIYKKSDESLVETIDVTSDQVIGTGTTQITINPKYDLAFNSDYYLQIDKKTFDDIYDNSFTGISDKTTISFKTRDNAPPVSYTHLTLPTILLV